MRKFTTFILLILAPLIIPIPVSGQNADINLLRDINGIHQTVGFSKFISNTTTEVGLAVPVVLGTVALINNDHDMLSSAIYIGASIGVDAVLTYGVKVAVNRPRPVVTYPSLITAYEPETDQSFPSGHTSFAFSVATSLSLKYPKWYVIAPAFVWAGSVTYSRMNLGVHYPSDVLTGAVFGAGSAWITYRINQWLDKKFEKKTPAGLQAYL